MEVKAPAFPESISEGTVSEWHVKQGENAKRDDLLVDIETDKVVIEVFATEDGVLTEIVKQEGEIVLSEEIIGTLKLVHLRFLILALCRKFRKTLKILVRMTPRQALQRGS